MAQRRHHYEHAFERFLRDHRVPYISVDEAKKSLMPTGVSLSARRGERLAPKLKNFDFVIYGEGGNLLVEVKGRRLPRVRLKDGSPAKPRMETWVTRDDVDAMRRWGELFGPGFEASFVFLYWCEDVPPDGLFVETLAHRGRWYTMRSIDVESYAGVMRDRSRKWGTVSVPAEDFERLSRPFSVPGRVGSSAGEMGYVREPIFERLGV
ncbi:MAG: HYExAFE family protein [bacterium]|nr:HYExAFE family protein [bacterium]